MLPGRVRRARLPAGSAWVDYRDAGAVCGHALPPGLVESDRLPEPIVTPATKAEEGHDLNITEAEAAALCGAEAYEAAREAALALYAFACGPRRGARDRPRRHQVRVRGRPDGVVTLGDEALTPDSSRFWPGDAYAPGGRSRRSTSSTCATTASRPGGTAPLPAPSCPADVVPGTRARYVEAFERLTEIPFAAYLADPEVVL